MQSVKRFVQRKLEKLMLKTNKITQDALVILAGGKSTRMGSDKASLPFGKLSVIESMIERFRHYFNNIYISAAQKDQLEILRLEERYGVTLIYDDVKACGPIGGLYAVFNQTKLESFYICAVDMPFADPEILLKCLPENKDMDYCVVSHDDGKVQPLFGWYHRRIFPVIQKLLKNHQYKMMHIFEQCNGQMICMEKAVLCGQCFFNMNDKYCYYSALDYLRNCENKNHDMAVINNLQNSANRKHIPVISIAAWSGTGKTTCLEKLIQMLVQRGVKIAVVKHDGHDFSMDIEGKDTDRFYKAGAQMVVISSSQKCAVIRRNTKDLSLEDIVSHITDVDLILVEGFKYGKQPKIELYRSAVCEKLMENITNRIAIISDKQWDVGVPVFPMENLTTVVEFLMDYINYY